MSIVRQLAQAILVLGLLGGVARLLAVTIGTHHVQDPAPAADDRPMWLRDQRGGRVLPGGDVGGDRQASEAFSVRFWHRDHPGVLVTYTYFAAVDDENPAEITIERETEFLVCTDPTDPGGTEVWSAYRWTTLPGGFATVQEAIDAALTRPGRTWCARRRGRVGRLGPQTTRRRGRGDVDRHLDRARVRAGAGPIVVPRRADPGLCRRAAPRTPAHRLAVERERTKQAALAHQRDALVWRELEHPASSSESASKPRS
jgi:hypothetical protein